MFWHGSQSSESGESEDVLLLLTGLGAVRNALRGSRMEVDIPVVESGTLGRRGCFDKS
jgi:hypothetical protein